MQSANSKVKTWLGLLLIVLTLILAVSSLPTQAAPTAQYPRSRWPREKGILENLLPDLEAMGLGLQSRPSEKIVTAEMANWSRIAFQSYRDGNWEVYLAKGDGADQVRVTDNYRPDIHPRINRGCTRIVFAREIGGDYDIFTANIDGSNEIRLTWKADNVNPVWSPDGTRIAFESYLDDQAEIYVMNVDGSGRTRLTNHDEYDGDPAWSPDGTKIAFVSERGGNDCIWTMNSDGSDLEQLSCWPIIQNPVWSPDGTMIAFDADADGTDDGAAQELWLMNADGSGDQMVYDTYNYAIGAWAGSWSPDGRYVAFTLIRLEYYNGAWHWGPAYLDAYDTSTGTIVRLDDHGVDWNPDWQTCDTQAPMSGVQALPSVSPGPFFMVNWPGSDTGGSGLKSYDVQVKENEGEWTDWQMGTTVTSALHPGVGGHTYYFRARARDHAGNIEPWPSSHDAWTMVEALPPYSVVQVPAFSRDSATVSWHGTDPGGSGIHTYDIQLREDEGTWTDWLTQTTAISGSFSGTAGHIYHFRSRATDNAQNRGDWSAEADSASTTFYNWGITGTVFDVRHTLLPEVSVAISPTVLSPMTSSLRGDYVGYVLTSTQYVMTATKTGYGIVAPMAVGLTADVLADHCLPPLDNIVENGEFEAGAGSLSGWESGGDSVPTVITATPHSGSAAAFLGPGIDLTLGATEAISGGIDSAPAITVDYAGNVHVAYVEANGIYYTRQVQGDWITPTLVATDHSSPTIEVGPAGELHIVWANESGVVHSHRPVSGTWSAPSVIATPGWAPDIAIDSQGTLHVVYTYRNPFDGWPGVHRRSRSAAGIWSDEEGVCGGFYGQVAVGPDDEVHAIVDEIGGIIWYRPPNGACTDVSLLPSAGGRLAVDSQGAVHILSMGYSEGYYSYWPGHGQFTHTPLPGYAGTGDLAVDVDGAVYIAHTNNNNAYLVYKPAGQDWSTPMLLDGTASGVPALAMDGNYRLHIINEAGVSANHYRASELLPTNVSSVISQSLTLHPGLHRPTLSFLYRLEATLPKEDSGLRVWVTDAVTSTPVLSSVQSTEAWRHGWVDLSQWTSDTIMISIEAKTASGLNHTHVELDEVTVGSWLTPVPLSITPDFVTGGITATLIISGENFILPSLGSEEPQVFLNDVLLSDVQSLDSTTLRGTASPLKPGVYLLRVVNAAGYEGVLPDALTVEARVHFPIVLREY